jgi:TPR repeat protein
MQLKSVLTTSIYLALIAFSSTGYATSDHSAVKEAIIKFNQKKASINELRKAAETDDKEAQFYLAETLRLTSGYMTPEARAWYERSAERGDMYSMFRLSRQSQDTCNIMKNCPPGFKSTSAWSVTLLKIAKEKALRGDGEGMEMMYTITGDLDWLIKSATTGYPDAQWWLAKRYVDGDRWFFWPGQREKEIERLYKASAEGGYPPSISEYAAILLEKGEIESAQQWLLKGVATGYAPAVGAYAYNLETGKYYHFEIDLQHAYALYLVLSEIGGGTSDAANYALEKLRPKLTKIQIAAAIQQAIDWKAAHPPVSYYPPKLEFY